MKNILQKNETLKPPKINEIVEGKIIGFGKASIYVDLGPRGTGIIYGKEFYETKNLLKELKIGDKIFAKIINLENEEGYIELSLKEADKELAWLELQKKKENNETIKVKILGANKGGLLVRISGISGFLPTSQLDSSHYPKVENGNQLKILKELQKLTGKELEVKIFDIDPKKEKLILSEKGIHSQKIKEILKNYRVGDVVEGEITGIADFGAFIKFNQNLEGLIHISELDWKLVEDPSEIVRVGDKIKVKIIQISNDGRAFLSLKALKKNPWEEIEKKFKKGDIISGKVTKFNPFGAFVEVTPEIQGLCHISEFGTRTKMEERLEIGKEYSFKILQIDSKEHRLILRLI